MTLGILKNQGSGPSHSNRTRHAVNKKKCGRIWEDHPFQTKPCHSKMREDLFKSKILRYLYAFHNSKHLKTLRTSSVVCHNVCLQLGFLSILRLIVVWLLGVPSCRHFLGFDSLKPWPFVIHPENRAGLIFFKYINSQNQHFVLYIQVLKPLHDGNTDTNTWQSKPQLTSDLTEWSHGPSDRSLVAPRSSNWPMLCLQSLDWPARTPVLCAILARLKKIDCFPYPYIIIQSYRSLTYLYIYICTYPYMNIYIYIYVCVQ